MEMSVVQQLLLQPLQHQLLFLMGAPYDDEERHIAG